MKHLPRLAPVAVLLTILPGCFLFEGETSSEGGSGGAGGEGPEYVVLPSTKAVKLSSGSNHFCALTEEGTVRCWGYNGGGQYLLGVEHEGGHTHVPIEVEGVTDVVDIDGSYRHTCVVMSGGTVKCWGYNDYGQLGDGTHGDGKPATVVQGITNAVVGSPGTELEFAL